MTVGLEDELGPLAPSFRGALATKQSRIPHNSALGARTQRSVSLAMRSIVQQDATLQERGPSIRVASLSLSEAWLCAAKLRVGLSEKMRESCKDSRGCGTIRGPCQNRSPENCARFSPGSRFARGRDAPRSSGGRGCARSWCTAARFPRARSVRDTTGT